MRPSRKPFPRRPSVLTCLLLSGVASQSAAAALNVTAIDKDGAPIGQVAVYAIPLDGATTRPATADAVAIMDQIDKAFVPHLLVIETGTAVRFPNSDSVSHHVYSFSDAKTFELGLYKGNAHPPLRFDAPGIVELGCNIHDSMLGYILVVDTPHFSLTGTDGSAALRGLPDGRYEVHVWTPRARPRGLPEPATVAVSSAGNEELVFRFTDKLLPPHENGGTSLSWDVY